METSRPWQLAARLRPPRLARGVVARPRLDGLLDLVRSHALTVVKAPPGYGKTTVAQSWAAALGGSGARVAWLSLHANDDDCERFFSALAAALRRAGAEPAAAAADGEAWCGHELSIPLANRLEWLVAELAADPAELYVFLDDYHELAQSEIHRALAEELRRAPEHVHVVLLTRTAPPIDLACLRARDAVLEIDGPTLCFDFAETQALLSKAQTAPPDAQDAAALHDLTGGWPAALRAAMLSARIHGGGVQQLRRQPGTLRSIHALFGELLASVPADLREFLECSSVAERLCAPLATRLSGRGDAQALLDQLERQQFFIDPLDDRQQWFAFHPLFRDFLLRSAQHADAGRVAATRRAAAHWFAEQRHWTEAIGQALAAGDTALALGWIEHHAMSVVGAGDLMTLLAWERELRSHLVESPLRLRLAFAWALGLAMACDKALVLLDGVEAQLDASAPEQHALRVECVALRAVLVCTTGDHELAATLAAQCQAQCTPGMPRPQWVTSALRNVAAATSLHHGRWDQLFGAAQAPAEAQSVPESDAMARVYRLSIRGLAEMRQGHLEDAASLLEAAKDIGAVAARPLAALPAPTLALVRYLQNQVATAGRINAAHIDVNKRVGPIEALYAAYLVAARVARHDGQPIRARQLVDEGIAIAASRRWRRAETVLLLEKVRLCLLDGRNADAHAGCLQVESLAAGARSQLDRGDFGRAAVLTRAWCDLADGRAERAVHALQPLAAAARAEQRIVDAITILGSLGLAQQALGDVAAACATLRDAAALVRDSGAVRALLDQAAPLAPLVAATLQSRAETMAHPWLAPLLGRWQRGGEAPPVPPRPAAGSLGSLSPREHHILGLLSDGQSNKQIARGLGIAPETVKTHVSKIFTKLGAQNRAQAAAMLTQE